jgi:hypothetical protein
MLVFPRPRHLGAAPTGFDSKLATNKTTGRNFREGLMTSIPRRKLLVGMTAAATLFAAPAIIRAQAKSLKVGVLLPRSGYMARDCPGRC